MSVCFHLQQDAAPLTNPKHISPSPPGALRGQMVFGSSCSQDFRFALPTYLSFHGFDLLLLDLGD